MTRLNRQGKRAAIITVMLLALAITCRMLGNNGFYPLKMGLIRSGIYIFLFAAWGVLLNRRIIQVQLRRYMIGIAGSMAFWFLLRTLKYHIIVDGSFPDMQRLIWYAYYIPMLMLPMFALFAAISLGKPEQYRTPFPLRLLWIPAALLALTVLTNDFHQMIFSFPTEYPVWTDDHYHYEIMYWIVLAWIVVSVLLAFGIILYKCRIPRNKTCLWLPLIPFSLMIAYGILYITAHSVIAPFAGDMTAANCVLIALFFESCIQCGLIQSNSHYTELFMASTVGAQITDKDLKVCYTAENVKPVEKRILERAKSKAVILEDGTRLCSEPILGGYVYWQEDISALLAVLDELSVTKEELKTYGGLLEEENKQKRRRKKLEEQKRLFEMVQETIKPHIAPLTKITKELGAADTESAAKLIMGKLTVIGAYLKRRSNLIMIADRLGHIPSEELHLCLRESEANLRLLGVTCALRFDLAGPLSIHTAGTLFDFYEAAIELSLDTLTDMTAFVVGNAASLHFTLIISCDTDMTVLSGGFANASVTNEDGVWYCTLNLAEGGDAL